MNKKKVIIGVLIAAIFVMVSFVPVANATTNNNQNINAVTSDVSHHNNNFNNQEINVIKYNYSSNMTNNNIHINMVFSTNNTCNNQHITENGKFGNVSVLASGNIIYLNMTIKPTNKINKVPGDCANMYYKFPKNYVAVLSVMKLPVLSLSVSTDATIVSVFGAVVSREIGSLGGALSDLGAYVADSVLPELLAPLVVVLAADYVALDVYANMHQDPTVYFDIGVSSGTQWWNFEDIGAYGEEGAFTGSANSGSSGIYIPLAEAGGHSIGNDAVVSYDPHTGVWNPGEEPPW